VAPSLLKTNNKKTKCGKKNRTIGESNLVEAALNPPSLRRGEVHWDPYLIQCALGSKNLSTSKQILDPFSHFCTAKPRDGA